MSIDERIIAIIAAYAYVAKRTVKEKRERHVTTLEVENKAMDFWRLSSKLEIMMRRAL